jgi:hypothetical protein
MIFLKKKFLLFAFAISCTYVSAQVSTARKIFRASVVKVDITPTQPKQLLGYGPRKSTGVHDRIHHRIVAMDDGYKQFFLVSSELCLVSPSEYDHVAALLKQRLRIDANDFWWTMSHTHSAPEVGVPGLAEAFMGERYKHPVDTAYTAFVEQTLIMGIEEAIRKLEPARLSAGWGFSQANINRRAIDVNGKASLGLNPDGPTDRRIGLIRLEKKDGKPLALIANYPIHGTVLGGESTVISGDVTGIVSQYVEDSTGAVVLFVNGAAGNLAPIYSVYPNPQAGHLMQFRVLLGDRILQANRQLPAGNETVRLYTGSTIVESPRKRGLSWPVYLNNYNRVTRDGNYVQLPIRFLRINDDIAVWAAPLELFCEISNEIRDRSPFPFTFYYGYTNGWLGYLPTEKEWAHGGYEVDVVSPFTPAIQRHLTQAVTAYIQGELRSGLTNESAPKEPRKIRRRIF